MEYKFNFKTENEKEKLIKENSNLTLIKIAYHLGESYLVFTDAEIIYDLSETEILANKISILEAENKALNTKVDTVKYTHSDLILDMDFRIMDIEDNLGIVPMKMNLLNRIGDNDMNSTFMLVLDKIEMGNYKNKEEIESICDRYLARNRITEEEYDTLMKALDKKEAEKNSVEA